MTLRVVGHFKQWLKQVINQLLEVTDLLVWLVDVTRLKWKSMTLINTINTINTISEIKKTTILKFTGIGCLLVMRRDRVDTSL